MSTVALVGRVFPAWGESPYETSDEIKERVDWEEPLCTAHSWL